jgi:hypothetical protein
MQILGDETQVEARSSALEIVLILAQLGARFVPNVL